MRSAELAKRNLKGVWRDKLSLGLVFALPVGLLLVLIAIFNAVGGQGEPYVSATFLAPGIALFGFVMLMLSSAMALSRDRESSLLARLFTAPLGAGGFIAGYSLPYLPVALIQVVVLFVVGAFFGLQIAGSAALVLLVLGLMAVFYVAVGMILGSVLTVNQVSAAYAVILMLTIFGGAWMDLSDIGGAFESVAYVFPFAHALDATRAVMVDGTGLGGIAADLVWVVGYTLVAVALAVGLFRRQMLK